MTSCETFILPTVSDTGAIRADRPSLLMRIAARQPNPHLGEGMTLEKARPQMVSCKRCLSEIHMMNMNLALYMEELKDTSFQILYPLDLGLKSV